MNGLRLLIVIVCGIAFQQLLNAQTTYTSVSTGEWNDTTIWSPAGIPGAGDFVHIGNQSISTNGAREVAGFSQTGGDLILTDSLQIIDGSLTVTGSSNWSGGGIIDSTTNNTGTLTIANTGSLMIQGVFNTKFLRGICLLNLGTIQFEGPATINMLDSTLIENQALFDITVDADFSGSGDGGVFLNTGTLIKSGGTNVSQFGTAIDFQNDGGTIDVQSGEISFHCPSSTFTDGNYNAAAGAKLSFNFNHTFEGTLSGNPAGTVVFQGSTINVTDLGATLDFGGTGFQWTDGTFSGSTLTIPNGSLFAIPGVFNTKFLSGIHLLNLGTIQFEGPATINMIDSTLIENQALFDITVDADFSGSGDGGVFLNTGTLIKSGGTNVSQFGTAIDFQNDGGTIDVQSGTLRIDKFENSENSIIKGIGTIQVPAAFSNDGINAPGNSAGLLTYLINYNPSSTGVLEIELGGLTPGSGHDQLAVTGNAVLNGTIDVSVTGSFIPAAGDSFVVLTSTGTVIDSFMNVNAQSGLYLSVKYKANNVTIVVDSVGVISSIEDGLDDLIATSYELMQNYPNPFNPSTRIRFSIPESAYTTLKVYSILGQEVATLLNEQKSSGVYEVNFDGLNLSSGTYIYKLKAGNFSETKKMILLK